MEKRDVIIVGAGHNGLTAAFYLAQKGLDVLVLERSDVVGGCCVTQEVIKGFKFNLGAVFPTTLHPKVVSDMRLKEMGLSYIRTDMMYAVPFPDGGGIRLYTDVERTCAEIARFSPRDAAAYPEFVQLAKDFSEIFDTVRLVPPPDMKDMFALVDDPESMETFKDIMFLSSRDLLNRYFENDRVKAALSIMGQDGYVLSPYTPGSPAGLLFHLAGRWAYVKGGMGAITQLMAGAAAGAGAEIRTGTEVAEIVVERGEAAGVRLADGTQIAARRIASNADPRRTFLNLISPSALEEKFIKKIKNFKVEATGLKIDLALDEMPMFTAFPGEPIGMFGIGPSLEYLERCYDDYKYGRPSKEPYMLGAVCSLADPSLAPPGKHCAYLWVQCAPYDLKEGNWDDIREEVADRAVETLARYAPNLRQAVTGRLVQTPLDLERRFYITRGDWGHGAMTFDQMFTFRPNIDCSGYRTPVGNFYLCGSGAHPGGGVSGVPGHNAARVMLDDEGLLEEETDLH